MAKYGTFRYDSGTKYGTGVSVASAAFGVDVVWIVSIDWDGTGWVNEADNLRDLEITRGRHYYVAPAGQGLESMNPGTANLILENRDRRYDPYYTTSPLYPHVLPGRRIQIAAYVVATKTTYVIFTGHITDIQPTTGIDQVTITAADGMQWLRDAEYNSGVVYSTTLDTAIKLVLDFVEWPYGRNILSTVQPLQTFEPGKGNGLSMIQDLAEANLGTFFVDRFGIATFYPVTYDTVTTHTIDQSVALKQIRVPQPWETVRNRITVIANRRGMRPGSVLWTLPGVEYFAEDQVRSFSATFARADSIAQPNPPYDFIALTATSGGDDVSESVHVAISEITATSCTVTVTNHSGYAVYVMKLQLVGHEIVLAPEEKRSEDATSIAAYGPRRFLLDNEWVQDRGYAAAYAVLLKDHLKAPQINPVVQIEQRPAVQFAVEIMDKVDLTSAALGISDTLRVGGIEHRWNSETGQSVTTTIYLQDVLVNADAITPDPFYPGTNDGGIIDVPFPYLPDWFDPWTPDLPPFELPDERPECLAFNAPPTGPYAATPNTSTLMVQPAGTFNIPIPYIEIYYPCTLRAGSSANLSKLLLTGTWSKYMNGSWIAITSNDRWEVYAVDAEGVTVATGVITNSGVNRIVTFSPASPVVVSSFRIKLLDSYATGTDVTFNFDAGAGYWLPSYAHANDAYIKIPSSTYVYAAGGKLWAKGTGSSWIGSSWRWTPSDTFTSKIGCYIEATLALSTNHFSYIGCNFDTLVDQWNYATAFGDGVLRYTVPDIHAGLDVRWFAWDNNVYSNLGDHYLDNIVIHGFDITSQRVKIVISDVKIYNVCA